MAQWAGGLSWERVPDAVRQVAAACVIDTFGVALAGSATDPARTALALCEAQAAGPSTVLPAVAGALGGGLAHEVAPGMRGSMQQAAFANAVAAHALDFDDNCYAGFVHGSAVIVPALLACAEAADARGTDMLTALVAGAECEYAVGAATRGLLYDKGWWTTGVLGPIGAAVACGKLLGLDAPRMAHALALAVGMASGTKSCFGSDAKPLMAGKAAQSGVQAAMLARAGASGPADPLSHAYGFAALYNQGVLDVQAMSSLGDRWYMLAPGLDIKRIPVCLSSHAAVDVLRELIAQHGVRAQDVESVVCDVPPIVVANLRHEMPRTPSEARFSMQFAIGMTLLDPDWGLPALAPEQVTRADLRDLMRRVRMQTGPSWDDPARQEQAPEGAVVQVRMRDGTTLEGRRDKALGSAAHPLSAAQLARKFMDCATPVAGEQRALRLLSWLQAVDGPARVRSLFEILAAPSPADAAGERSAWGASDA